MRGLGGFSGYDGHFHDLLNDLGKEAVMGDIRRWIDARLPA